MKILALRLSNLASITGEYQIDFEATPLAQAGLIAITGKTGAGKSTLLDAMCLALFDQIPRLTGAVGSLMDASGQGISIKDSKHILRRGCTHGFAEVEFLALDQKRYKAHWEIKRARNKLDGNLKIDRAIQCLEDGRVLTQKISECTPTVQKLIGLSFEQFTRAVLLAQSEVGAFLKAKDQDRADLLEYLTNSGIFSIISQLSFAKTKHFKDELEQLQRLTGHIELLSADQVAALQQQQTTLSQSIQQQLHTQKQWEHDQQWYARQQQLQTQQQSHAAQLAALQLQDASIQQQQLWLKQLEQFAEIKSTWLTLNQSLAVQAEQQKQLQDAQRILAQHETDLTQQQQIQSQAEQQLKQHKAQCHALAPILEQALALDSKRGHLQEQYVSKNKEIEAAQPILQTEQAALQQALQLQAEQQQQCEQSEVLLSQSQDLAEMALEPKANLAKISHFLAQTRHLQQQLQTQSNLLHSTSLADSATSVTSTQFNLQQVIAELATAQQALAAALSGYWATHGSIEAQEAELEQCHNRLMQLQQQRQAAQALQRSVVYWDDITQQLEQSTQAITPLELKVQQLHTQQLQAKQQLQQAEQHFDQLQHILADQRILQSEHVAGLRAQLQPNQPCMVCGSQTHPFIEHAELLDQAIHHLHTEQRQQASLARAQAQQHVDATAAAYVAAQTERNSLQQQQARLQQQRDAALQQVQLDYARSGFTFALVQPQAVRDCAEACTELEQQLQQLSQQQLDKQNALKSGKSLLLQQQQQQQTAEALAQYQQAEAAILQGLSTTWTAQWHAQPLTTAHTLAQQIEQRVAQSHQLRTQQDALQHTLAQVHALNEKLTWQQQQLDTLLTQQQQITREGKQIKLELMTLIQQHSVVTYASAREWQTALSETQSKLEFDLDQIRLQLVALEQRYRQQKTLCAEINSQLQLRQQHIDEMQQQKQQWLQQHPEFNDALLERCLNIQANEKQALQDQIQHYLQQRQDLQTQLGVYTAQLLQLEQSKPELSLVDIEKHLTELNASIADLNQQRDGLNAQLLSHAESSRKMAEFQQQMVALQAEVNRWGKISTLIGSKEGTKFQRIAQEHHLDILVEYANLQLQPLAPRYRLQRIPDSLSLAIIDQDMNDEVRPVLSLSGGETFLVSLALALAIANMASNNSKLESLFIDEGFGTLDPTSLHMVMDALDRLQSQGRKVVLISHVQEMHERIPVQIQVQPIAAGASKICIVG